jgi:hypothetical protein
MKSIVFANRKLVKSDALSPPDGLLISLPGFYRTRCEKEARFIGDWGRIKNYFFSEEEGESFFFGDVSLSFLGFFLGSESDARFPFEA